MKVAKHMLSHAVVTVLLAQSTLVFAQSTPVVGQGAPGDDTPRKTSEQPAGVQPAAVEPTTDAVKSPPTIPPAPLAQAAPSSQSTGPAAPPKSTHSDVGGKAHKGAIAAPMPAAPDKLRPSRGQGSPTAPGSAAPKPLIPSSSERPFPYNWAISGSVGFGDGPGGLSGLAGLSVVSGVTVEYRVVPHLWLMGRVRGAYAQGGDGGEEGVSSSAEQRSSSGFFDGGLGVRAVYTPDSMFRFSNYLTVGGFYQRTRQKLGDPGDFDLTVQVGAAVAQLGATLEYGLSDRIYVGVSSDIARAQFGVRHEDSVLGNVEQDAERNETWFLGFAFSPALQLRLYFE